MSEKKDLIAVGLLFLLFCQPVPVTERQQLQLIPRSQIIELSSSSFQEVSRRYDVITGTNASEMVQRIGRRIQQATETYLREENQAERLEGLNWEFALLDSNVVNAFAMPGGEVGVFQGMMSVAQRDDELAVVIGHEVAHTVAGHGNERMSQLLLLQLGGIALEEALQQFPEQTQALALVAFGVGAQLGVLLPYSRLHETEADRLGLIFMALAGYDPGTALGFWERMAEMQRGESPPEFLSTHPSYQTRIENIKEFLPEAMQYYQRAGGQQN